MWCIVSVVVCSCWRVLLLLVSFNALQRTGECATAISSKEYPSRRITRLASLRNTCESLSLAVEPRCSTFVGKHSAIFTDSLRKSAFFSSLFVFSSIFCCVSGNYYYLCIGSFLVRGLDPTFRQSWLFQVCLSYFKAICGYFIVGVGSVHSINDHHDRIEVCSSYPVM